MSPQVVVTVEPQQVELGEEFQLQVRVEAEAKRIAEPVIPHADGIRFDRQARYRHSRRVLNQRVEERSYPAWAMREGLLTIPRVSVRIDGRNYLSEEVTVRVVRSRNKNRIPSSNQNDNKLRPVQPTTQLSVENIVMIESKVDKPQVYQGESMELILRLLTLDYGGVEVYYRGGRTIPLPSLEGFYTGEISDSETLEERGGWKYRVREFRVPMYPTGSGKFTIGAWAWEGDVRWESPQGRRRMYRNLLTEPVPVLVKALPERPDGFSGAVGRFTMAAQLSEQEIVQGVPVQLLVRVTGWGNPDAVSAPVLPEISWGQVGEPRAETRRVEKSDWNHIEKRFVYDITPYEAGMLEIPKITFCYFAPAFKGYRSEKAGPFALRVRSAEESNAMVVVGGVTSNITSTQVEMVGEDLHPIFRKIAHLNRRPVFGVGYAWAMLLPPVLFTVFWLWTRRQWRLKTNPAYARRNRAYTKVRKSFSSIMARGDAGEALYRALVTYIADRVHMPSAGLTSADVKSLLDEAAAPPAMKEALVRVLRACERARYSGGALQKEEVAALLEAAQDCVQRLESEWGWRKEE